jgi:hypothetical protein
VNGQVATEKALDAEGAITVSAQQQTPPGDRAMKLVIFIEDQQFVLHFGPEAVESESK